MAPLRAVLSSDRSEHESSRLATDKISARLCTWTRKATVTMGRNGDIGFGLEREDEFVFAAWAAPNDGSRPCAECDAQPWEPCKNIRTGAELRRTHGGRTRAYFRKEEFETAALVTLGKFDIELRRDGGIRVVSAAGHGIMELPASAATGQS